ncbi:MAG: hypothetical protein GQ574_19275 [Crocinitomix sp.]|nr:hypothetical protein [Crocinitomix sp.]
MRLIFIHFLLLLTTQAFAYELKPQHRNYSVNDGLPSSQVYEIIQDSKGYIWFGTDRGLVRYNGYEFKTFTVQDGLTSNVIFHVDEGPGGTIYAYGKDRQISCYRDNKFYEFKFNDSLMVYQTHRVNLLEFDFSRYGFSYSASDNYQGSVPHVFLSNQNKLQKITNWQYGIIDNERGTNIFGKTNDSLRGMFINGTFLPLINPLNGVIRAAAVKYENVIYFTLDKILYQFDYKQPDRIDEIKTFDNYVLDLKVDENGNLYIGFFIKGLLKINVDNLLSEEYLIKDVSISSVLIDENKGIWASSLYSGLYYFEDQEKYKVELSTGQQLDQLETLDRKIYGISDDAQFFKFEFGEDSLFEMGIANPLQIRSKPHATIVFDDGNMYGKIVADLENETLLVLTGANQIILGDSTFFTLITNSIDFWNLTLKSNERYNMDLFLNCGMLDDQDRVILGTDEGVKVLQYEMSFLSRTYYSLGYDRHVYQAAVSDFMPNNVFFRNKIRSMKNVGDSLYIFGSSEKGVYIEQTSGENYWLKKANGLVSDAIDQVHYTGEYIVAISKQGFSVISKQYGIVNYTRRNGLLSNEANDVLIQNDSIWTVTKNGTSLFLLNREINSTMPINLTSIYVNENNKPIQTSYQLQHQDRTLEVSYEALSYIQEGDVNYKYQLKGVDNNWISTQNRTVRYSNLPAGKFSFWLMVENSENSWTNPICLFEVSKPKPFWLTIYFIGFVLLLFVGLTWLFLRWRYRRFQRKESAKLQVLNLERKTLQAQMNPHFIFNSLTSLQNLIIKNDPDLANEYLGKFARLTRIALLQSTQNWVKLKDEITLLEHYIELEQIRFPDHFQYSINIKIEDQIIFIPPFLIQPFVENAILHGLSKKRNGGMIKISVEANNEQMIQFTIIDNGIGRNEASDTNKKRHKSLGIRLIKERLQILLKMNAVEIVDLFDDKQNAIGTKVVVYVPFKNKIDESVNN